MTQKLKIVQSKSFKKAYKKYKHDKDFLITLEVVLKLLEKRQPLPSKYKDHVLKGKLNSIRECHIRPDDLLLYYVLDEQNLLKLYALGSHADLLGM